MRFILFFSFFSLPTVSNFSGKDLRNIKSNWYGLTTCTQIFYFPKKMASWVSVTLKCRGQVLQARHVVQCARECSYASLLPKII